MKRVAVSGLLLLGALVGVGVAVWFGAVALAGALGAGCSNAGCEDDSWYLTGMVAAGGAALVGWCGGRLLELWRR